MVTILDSLESLPMSPDEMEIANGGSLQSAEVNWELSDLN
jgi:hypothetical protein